MSVYLGWLLVVLGIAQLYAGADGVSTTCVRVGAALVSVGLSVVAVSAIVHVSAGS